MPLHPESFVEAAILISAAGPAIQSCCSRRFWVAFPGLASRLALLLFAYVVAVAVTVYWAPGWFVRTCTAVAGLWIVALVWHERVAVERAWRWPPGSLRPLPLGPWFNRSFFLNEQQRVGSPFKTVHFARPMVCFIGLRDGFDFLKRHEASLASPPLAFGRFIPGGFLRHMAPDRHGAAKRIFRRALAPAVYEPLEPFMRETIHAELDRMVTLTAPDGGGIAPRAHIERIVFAIWARLFFRIAEGSTAFSRLGVLYRVIDIRNPGHASDRSIRSALEEIDGIIKRQLDADRASRSEEGRSLLEAIAIADPSAVDDPTIVHNLIYLMHTSWADVSGLLQWLWRMMTEHPEWALRLRDRARQRDGDVTPPLSTRIVMETLRLEQSEQLYRVTTRRVEHAGIVIPRGWLVRLCVRESHQDASVFDNPGSFDPDRFLRRTYSRQEYAPFGGTLPHACLGEGLTTTIGRIFVEELAAFDWRTVADGACEYGPWRHWRPSSQWRVALARAR